MSEGPIFAHEKALIESKNVGSGTRVWAFAHVLPGARIGADCNICDHTFIENDVVIGDRVTVKSGVQLWDGLRLEDDVFVGPNATFTNDPFPRSKQYLDEHPITVIRRGASIGANATILPGVTIGRYAMVGAGAVVTSSVPPHAVAVGNPARIIRYEDDPGSSSGSLFDSSRSPESALEVSGVSLHRVQRIEDPRGDLIAREVGAGLPFTPQRSFVIVGSRPDEVRGEHAHRKCEQLLVCVEGSLVCMVDDGVRHQDVLLDNPQIGLYIPPMIWATQYRYTEGAILLVFASDPYDPADYIHDYEAFLSEV